jgi:hypothetical protein
MALFPKKLFVKVEEDNGASHFVVAGDPLYLTKSGETIKVGVYEFIEMGQAEGAVNYRAMRKEPKRK